MISATAATLADRHQLIYQLGSSDSNPFRVARSVELTGLYKRRYYRARSEDGVLNKVRARLESFPVTAAREMSEPFHKLKFAGGSSYYDQMRVALPRLIKDKGAKKICTIYQDDEFGLEVFRGAEAGLKAVGMDFTEKTTYKRGATDFSSQVAKMKASGCDMVVLGTIIRETIGAIGTARKLGYNQIVPQVSSGDLSAPSIPGSKIDVKQAGAAILTLTYMATEDVSFELYAGLPYQHDIEGDGSIKGVGKIASVKQVSPTLFAQYRFFDKNAMVRPYVGLGLTYAYFYGEEGSGTLTALTNPGSGQATLLEIDDAWGLSPQLGASVKIDRNWFVDVSVIKSFIKAKSHLSTGQSIEAKLDPMAYNLSVGYRF